MDSKKQQEQSNNEETPRSNSTFITVIVVLLVIIIGAVAYFLQPSDDGGTDTNVSIEDFFPTNTAVTNSSEPVRLITIAKTCTDETKETTYGGARIEVPENALDAGVEITSIVFRGDIGCTVDFEPKGLMLKSPAILTMAYTDDGLEKIGFVNDLVHQEKDFIIAFWDEGSNQFIGLESNHDTVNNQVTASIMKLYAGGFVIIKRDKLNGTSDSEDAGVTNSNTNSSSEAGQDAPSYIYYPNSQNVESDTNTNTDTTKVTIVDADGDKLDDRVEGWFGLSSDEVDSDGDGHEDYDEIVSCYNPIGIGAMTSITYQRFCEAIMLDVSSFDIDIEKACEEWQPMALKVIDGTIVQSSTVNLSKDFIDHCARTQKSPEASTDDETVCDFMFDVITSICDPESIMSFIQLESS